MRHKEVTPITALEASVGPSLTEQEARQIFAQGEEAVVFALLALATLAKQKQTPAADSPSTPSGDETDLHQTRHAPTPQETGTSQGASWHAASDADPD